MKRIYKYLVPGFLKRWDGYLLERYPVVWHTGIHFVGFYGVVGALVLFGVGFLYPVHRGGKDWVVDPIRPIEFVSDEMYTYTIVLVFIFTLIWVYRQFQLKSPFYSLSNTLVILMIYFSGSWLLFGFTSSAFRIATILHVANAWMKSEHLESIKKSEIYPYGFVLLKKDTVLTISRDMLNFFENREKEFKIIWEEEEVILNYRYDSDTSFWHPIWKEKYESYQNYQKYRDYLSYLKDRSYLNKRSYQSFLHYISPRDKKYIPSLAFLFSFSNFSNTLKLTDQSYRSNIFFRLDRSYFLDHSNQPNILYLLNSTGRPNSKFSTFRSYILIYTKLRKPLNTKRIQKIAMLYKFQNNFDTVYNDYNDQLIILPSLPNQLESAVRSVEHAQVYLQKGIYRKHFAKINHYLMFFVVMLFLIPFLSLRSMVVTSFSTLIFLFIFYFFRFDGYGIVVKNWWIFNVCAYLSLPGVGLIALIWMFLNRKRYTSFAICINAIFLGMVFTSLSGLKYGNPIPSNQLVVPIDVAFYGTQIFGFLAACLIPYVQAMPKKG